MIKSKCYILVTILSKIKNNFDLDFHTIVLFILENLSSCCINFRYITGYPKINKVCLLESVVNISRKKYDFITN